MVRQDKVKAQVPSNFFADGRGNRQPVPGTVPSAMRLPPGARRPADVQGDCAVMGGAYNAVIFSGSEGYADTGKVGTNWGNGIPFTVTKETIEGPRPLQDPCAVCHGSTGAGNGIATKYGLVGVANLHQQRLRDMTDGEIYNTIANGKDHARLRREWSRSPTAGPSWLTSAPFSVRRTRP